MLPNARRSRTGNRVGLYAWAGPDTIRMIRVKYGDRTRVDDASFLSLYEPEALAHVRDTLGVTDMWVTYSWGFSDAAERTQRAFLRSKLPHFRKAGISTHAYVQGFNILTSDFTDIDFFCKDAKGRCQPYSRGRSLICPNAPATKELLLRRVGAASDEDVDGVFVDNMLFGMPPTAVYSDFLPTFGCACRWCAQAFQETFGKALPTGPMRGERTIGDILRFRAASIARVIGECSALARSKGKQFGVNLYDPMHHTPELYFGYNLRSLDPHLDYRLIENHALAENGADNTHLSPLLDESKPTFVVSYRRGIGRDGAYSQRDIDAIFADARAMDYAPCLKASEYVTNGIWHALRWREIQTPKPGAAARHPRVHTSRRPQPSTTWKRAMATWLNAAAAACAQRAFAVPFLRKLIAQSPLYTAAVRQRRVFDATTWGIGP